MRVSNSIADLRQQIHDDLRIQHPEWVEPNGESSMCLLGRARRIDAKRIQRVCRCSSSRPRTGINCIDTVAV